MERKVFAWIVHYLRPLVRVPGLAHLFDSALFAWTALMHPPRRMAMEKLEEAILARWPCTLGTHRLGGSAFRLGGMEIAHLHGNGLLDVRLNPTQSKAFIAKSRAQPHHLLGASSWVSYWLTSTENIPEALDLLNAAIALNPTYSPNRED
jgi:hypothetical protein